MAPIVSILINSWCNETALLSRSIESCLNQHGVKVQLILSMVSGDTQIDFVRSKYKSVLIVENEKPNIYGQINNAIQHITGDYYFYFSGNDECFPYKSMYEIDCIESNKKPVCYSAFYKHYFSGSKVLLKFLEYDYQKHLESNFISDVAMVKVGFLKSFLPFHERWGNYAYYDLWLRMYESCGNVFCYNPAPQWVYFVRKNSLHVERSKDENKVREFTEIKNKMIAYHRGLNAN